jgi:hypothetical protein
MRIKKQLLGCLSEARLLVLRLMEGFPDTGSHPAKIGIGVSYGKGASRGSMMECV